MVRIIGITGRSGSGKTTLTKLLSEKLMCNSIDVDKIGHMATSDEKIEKKLCEIFGYNILNKDNKIDRKKLGNIVFSSKEKMDILTEITWGYMREKLNNILENETGDTIIFEWALLPISDFWNKCDTKILISADYTKRKDKVLKRDGIPEEYFTKREMSSIDYSNYEFDYFFKNDYEDGKMEEFVNEIIK